MVSLRSSWRSSVQADMLGVWSWHIRNATKLNATKVLFWKLHITNTATYLCKNVATVKHRDHTWSSHIPGLDLVLLKKHKTQAVCFNYQGITLLRNLMLWCWKGISGQLLNRDQWWLHLPLQGSWRGHRRLFIQYIASHILYKKVYDGFTWCIFRG